MCFVRRHQVQDEHFGANGSLEVRCRATVSAVYREGDTPEAMPVVLGHKEDFIRGDSNQPAAGI